MPSPVDCDELSRLLAVGAQLVEVLPRDDFDEKHIEAAIELPLKDLSVETASVLDRSRPVIVYCWDALLDMSPRAAWRLERLGYGPVHDYVAGKVDWMAAGLATVRADPAERRALGVADLQPPTGAPTNPIMALPRTSASSWSTTPASSWARSQLTATRHPPKRPSRSCTPGPTTVRTNEALNPLLERMSARNVTEMIFTTPDGRLLGVVRP